MCSLLVAVAAVAAHVHGQVDIHVNECASGVHDCHADAACLDTEDGFTCACLSGFTGDGQACDPCIAVEHSTEVSCTDLNSSTAIACAPGYFRTLHPGSSDTCEPRAPAPAPTPAPEPSEADVAEIRMQQRETAPFVALTLVLLAAIFVVLLPVTCLACRATACPSIHGHGADGSPV